MRPKMGQLLPHLPQEGRFLCEIAKYVCICLDWQKPANNRYQMLNFPVQNLEIESIPHDQ